MPPVLSGEKGGVRLTCLSAASLYTTTRYSQRQTTTMQLDHLNQIRSLFEELAAGRQEYDFQEAAWASHAEHFATQPDRLRDYAKQVISARMVTLLVSSRINTQALLSTYLLGVAATNPFPMLLAARSQLELFSVVADVTTVIRENAGEHTANFAARVRRVDEALITATYGTKHPLVKEAMMKLGVSRLRSPTSTDLAVLTAKNVLTRLDKLSKSGTYPGCKYDYERLCEYVHPNIGMNTLYVVASPLSDELLRFSLKSPEPFERALSASAPIMARAARGTVAAMDTIQPPFGMPTFSSPSEGSPPDKWPKLKLTS
jgi:hypothetical protein